MDSLPVTVRAVRDPQAVGTCFGVWHQSNQSISQSAVCLLPAGRCIKA